ncbi:MAG: radical SAM protein [Candidatus Aureabacteria bacterium]|nr:radical SAM protein [Candidatus Auribacterota bacterium]
MTAEKAKVLLVQPSWSSVHGSFAGVAAKKLFLPPIGICYLAASLSRAGYGVEMLDLEAGRMSLRETLERIGRARPGLLGVTATTPAYSLAREFCGAVKEALPGLPIVIGGPHVSGTGAEELDDVFDFALLGESELSLPLLADAVRNGGGYEEVPGLAYRSGGILRRTPRGPLIEDLDGIPFPRRDLLDVGAYATFVPGKGLRRTTTITASRGCPFGCVFCSAHVILGKRFRIRSVGNILGEIEEARGRFGIVHFYFNDSTLTLKRGWILKLCEGLSVKNLGITWEGMTRVNMIDRELLRTLRRAGFVRLSLGIESGEQRILDIMKKGVTLEEIREAYRLCREERIETESFAMLGLPGETRETIRRTARFVRSIPEVRYSSFSIATPYPGSELMAMAKEGRHGLKLLSGDYRRYRRYDGGVMEVNGLSPEDLQREQKRGLLVMHLTPRKMCALIRHFGLRMLAGRCIAILRDLMRGPGNRRPEDAARV